MPAGSQRNHALMARLSKPLIRPVGHLLPDGEGKEFMEIVSSQTIHACPSNREFRNPGPVRTMTQSSWAENPRPFWERGDRVSGG